MSELAEKLIAENIRTKNPRLDLGNCGLEGTEDELYKPLRDASHLETLIFSNTWWEFYDKKGRKGWHKKRQEKSRKRTKLKKCPIFLPSNIKELYIAGEFNPKWSIQDFSPILPLKKLQKLFIGANATNDFSFLQKFSDLRVLSLYESEISDCNFLKQLTKLDNLDLEECKINDEQTVSFPNSLKVLNLEGTLLQDYSTLEKLKNLQALNLSSNELPKIPESITNFSNLEYLYLGCNDIKDYSSLHNFTKLKQLDLSRNDIQKPPIFKGFKYLEVLNLEANLIEDASFLKELNFLKEIDINTNNIEKIEVHNFPYLESLSISGNPIKHLSLIDCPKLSGLGMDNHRKVEPMILQNIHNLTHVDIHIHSTEELSFLKENRKIQFLRLWIHDGTFDISSLHNFKDLERVSLGFENGALINFDKLKTLHKITSLKISDASDYEDDTNLDYIPYPPICYAYWKNENEFRTIRHDKHLHKYTHLPELPEVQKIWQIMRNGAEENINLAHQLALGQGWTEEEFKMYKSLL